MNNWIPDTNRFNLSAPPAFWLRTLWEFDSSLAVIPSRQQPLYRLAQRRKLNLPEKMMQDPFFQESDTKMLASYGLIPVTSILGTADWHDPYMFVELANRAPHRLGGADKVNAMLEEQDAKDDLNKQVQEDAHLSSLGKDAWGLYNKKIGVRSHMYIPRTRESIVGAKAPAIRIK